MIVETKSRKSRNDLTSKQRSLLRQRLRMGADVRELATEFDVSAATIYRLRKRTRKARKARVLAVGNALEGVPQRYMTAVREADRLKAQLIEELSRGQAQ